jgi:hypothetical protein
VSADLTPKQVVQLAKVVKEEFRDETENCLRSCWKACAKAERFYAVRGKLRAGLKSVLPGYGRFANRTGSYAVEDHRVRSTAGGEGYL